MIESHVRLRGQKNSSLWIGTEHQLDDLCDDCGLTGSGRPKDHTPILTRKRHSDRSLLPLISELGRWQHLWQLAVRESIWCAEMGKEVATRCSHLKKRGQSLALPPKPADRKARISNKRAFARKPIDLPREQPKLRYTRIDVVNRQSHFPRGPSRRGQLLANSQVSIRIDIELAKLTAQVEWVAIPDINSLFLDSGFAEFKDFTEVAKELFSTALFIPRGLALSACEPTNKLEQRLFALCRTDQTNAFRKAKWRYCSATREPLVKPSVRSHCVHNKEPVIISRRNNADKLQARPPKFVWLPTRSICARLRTAQLDRANFRQCLLQQTRAIHPDTSRNSIDSTQRAIREVDSHGRIGCCNLSLPARQLMISQHLEQLGRILGPLLRVFTQAAQDFPTHRVRQPCLVHRMAHFILCA